MLDDPDVSKWIVRGIIGLAFAFIGSLLIGQGPSIVINFGSPPAGETRHPLLNPGQGQSQRAAEDERRKAEEKQRQEDAKLAEIQRREAAARGEAEAQQRKLEAIRAAEEVEAAKRRLRAAAEAEREEKARKAAAWRAANGGCDPGWRQQCMTVGSSGGGSRQVIGCSCVPAH